MIFTFDDFSERAEAVRAQAIRAGFGPIEHGGAVFHGIGTGSAEAERDLERAVGFPVRIDMEFFRLGLEGTRQPTWIHMDAGCSEFACVWYLTPDRFCQGGTAFWRHRETGLSGIDQADLTPDFADQLNRETHDKSKWERGGLVYMKFNRAAIYPTSRFHSQYPQGGFGQTPENGRLVWCAFFSRR